MKKAPRKTIRHNDSELLRDFYQRQRHQSAFWCAIDIVGIVAAVIACIAIVTAALLFTGILPPYFFNQFR